MSRATRRLVSHNITQFHHGRYWMMRRQHVLPVPGTIRVHVSRSRRLKCDRRLIGMEPINFDVGQMPTWLPVETGTTLRIEYFPNGLEGRFRIPNSRILGGTCSFQPKTLARGGRFVVSRGNG